MRGGYRAAIIFLAAAVAPAEAGAVKAPGPCHVVAGDKLPRESGGAKAVCAEVERAIAAAAPNVRYSAEIKVVTPSMLAATLIVNGRTLPEQKFAVMDRRLDGSMIKRFANSLASEVAKAVKS